MIINWHQNLGGYTIMGITAIVWSNAGAAADGVAAAAPQERGGLIINVGTLGQRGL